VTPTSSTLRTLVAGELFVEELQQSPDSKVRQSLGRWLLILADFAAVAVAIGFAAAAGSTSLTRWAVCLPIVFWALAAATGLYSRDEFVLSKTTLDEAPKVLSVAAVFVVLAARGPWFRAPVQPVIMWVVLTLCVLAARSVARLVSVRLAPSERVLVIGDEAAAARVERVFVRNPSLNATVVGRIDSRPASEARGDWWSSSVDALRQMLTNNRVDRVVVVSPEAAGEGGVEFVRQVKTCGVKVGVLPSMLEVMGSSVEYDDLGGQALLSLRPFGLGRQARALKRLFDLTAAGLGLLLLSPVMAAVAIAIMLDSRGPVMFRQTRIGRLGRPFQMMKFRTMVTDAESRRHELLGHNEAAPLFKIANDPRTTSVGRFLRRQSLDELPQLLNVLRGEMSIVGPRPLLAEEDRLFSGWQRHRNHIAPGITGPWQILGSTRVPWEDMVTLDYLYGANWSLWLDIKIILRTVPAILSQRSGEYPDPTRRGNGRR
jgi:exopolysaccharide biosynthesis polyprenyl glycosylphosphotransferase